MELKPITTPILTNLTNTTVLLRKGIRSSSILSLMSPLQGRRAIPLLGWSWNAALLVSRITSLERSLLRHFKS